MKVRRLCNCHSNSASVYEGAQMMALSPSDVHFVQGEAVFADEVLGSNA